MTFNGLTDDQAERLRRQFGENRSRSDSTPRTAAQRFRERCKRIPIKIYLIVLLFCLCFGIAFSRDKGLWGVAGCAVSVLLSAAAVFVCCVWENSLTKHTNKKRSTSDKVKCKVYRCGNTVTEIYSGDIVKGDYVLLTSGDTVPAEGIVQTGDITVERDGKTDLIRRHREDELDEDVSGEYTLERGTLITSGYAVMKVTSVGDFYIHESSPSSRGYIAGIICCTVLTAALTFFASYSSEAGTAETADVPIMAAFYSSLILISGAGIKNPSRFYLHASKTEIQSCSVQLKRLTPQNDLIFIDKRCFITDGKPRVTGFTDGTGKIYANFYEVPYPLGTIAAKAAAENTNALVNKGNIISADPYEAAEMKFMAERLKSTSELEISPELVNGTLAIDGYKRFITGSACDVIPKCEKYFDGAGRQRDLTSAAAIKALSEELVFQGSRVYAYAAELWDGKKVFIGMITIREKVRRNAEKSWGELSKLDKRPILLVPDNEASLPDKALTAAGAENIISFEKLAAMDNNEAAKALKKIKIITGRCSKEQLIELASGKSVGITAIDARDAIECEKADTVYAAYESCAAAQEISDAVFYEGINSFAANNECSANVRKTALGYEMLRFAMMIITAAAMLFAGALGAAAFTGATLMCILITGLGSLLLGKLCKMRCADCDKKEARQ